MLNLFQNFCFAQTYERDSLKLALKNAKHDTVKCNILNVLIENENDEKIWAPLNDQLLKIAERNASSASTKQLKTFYLKYFSAALNNIGFLSEQHGDISGALEFYNKSLIIKEEIKDKLGIAVALNNIGNIFTNKGDIPKALEYLNKALNVQKEINDKEGIARSLNNMGIIYDNQGNITKALEYYHKSLKIQEEMNFKRGAATSLNNIGYIIYSQGEMSKALEYYHKALKIYEEVNDKVGISRALNNIGLVHNKRGEIDIALNYYHKSLKIEEEIMNRSGIATGLSNLGYAYGMQGNKNKSLNMYRKALKIFEEINDKRGIAESSNNNAIVMIMMGQFEGALAYAERGLLVSKELGFPENIRNASEALKKIYKKLGRSKEAFEMYELYIQMRDSINSVSTRKSTFKKQFQIEYEREAIKDSVANIAKMQEEQLKHQQAITQQRTYTYGGGIGFMLMLVVAGVSFKAFKSKQKANVIITEQKLIAEHQKHIIEEKQKEIIDSINYARRIQRAHLPNEKYITKKMTELKK